MSRDFDGVDDQITISSTFDLGQLNCSMWCWVHLSSTSLGGAFIKCGNTTTGYGLGVGGSTFDDTGNNIICLYENVAWIDTNINIGTGWHFLGLGISALKNPVVWLDGKFVFSNDPSDPIAPSTTTTFGGYTSGVPSERFVSCKIAHVQIFNRGVGSDNKKNDIIEVNQIMRFPGSLRKGLAGYWPLWGGSPEGDYSGNKNFGSITGATLSTNNPPINGIFTVPKPELIQAF